MLNDYLVNFVGKLCYQTLEYPSNGFIGIQSHIWVAWLLTFGTSFVSSLLLLFTQNLCNVLKSYRTHGFKQTIVPALFDVWSTFGGYISLVFLPASIVTLLRHGFLLFFSAFIKRILDNKQLSTIQYIGIFLTGLGCIIACFESIYTSIIIYNSDINTMVSIIISLFIMLSVGLSGSIRNFSQQNLLYMYDLNFIVGIRRLISLIIILIIGITLLSLNAILIKNNKTWDLIGSGIIYTPHFTIFLVSFFGLLLVIYGRNITHNIVIRSSNPMIRNLMMATTPMITYILSLCGYYIIGFNSFGESFNVYQLIRISGFIIVLIGSYLYMKYFAILPQILMKKIHSFDHFRDYCKGSFNVTK